MNFWPFGFQSPPPPSSAKLCPGSFRITEAGSPHCPGPAQRGPLGARGECEAHRGEPGVRSEGVLGMQAAVSPRGVVLSPPPVCHRRVGDALPRQRHGSDWCTVIDS